MSKTPAMKLIPIDSTTGGHQTVADMARDLLEGESAIVEKLEDRLNSRQLVKSLAIVRARSGLTQHELADKMGCKQPKISKLENGVDKDVQFGDVTAFLQAVGHEMKIFVVPAGGTLANEVKMHAFRIKHLLDRMVSLARTDGAITKGLAAFIEEAAFNLARFTKMAEDALPRLRAESSGPIHVEAPESAESTERTVKKLNHRDSQASRKLEEASECQ